MGPFFACVVIAVSLLAWATSAASHTLTEPDELSDEARQEAAGLPNLAAINKTATEKASASATVQTQLPRIPSFYYKGQIGTEITEYRSPGKKPEIKVHSNFGTYYYLPTSSDTTPAAQNNGIPEQRLPAMRFSY